MKLLALLLLCTPVYAFDVQGRVITLTDDEIAQCKKGGQCVIVSQKDIDKLVKDSHKIGFDAALKLVKKTQQQTRQCENVL